MRFPVYILFLLLLVSCNKEFNTPSTKVLGHGGESIYNGRNNFPPNHFLSARFALEALGAHGVELDVQMTRDSVLVLYHDYTLDKNSTGTGCIPSLDWIDIKELEIYNSDYNLSTLQDVFELYAGKVEIFLDVKHWNECTDEFMDYSAFNHVLTELLSDMSPAQKSLITVNCRDIDLFAELTDPYVKRSYESDILEPSLTYILNDSLDMLSVKLEAMSPEIEEIKNSGVQLTIYNIKTRTDVFKALEYAPDFVISDNISTTLKAING